MTDAAGAVGGKEAHGQVDRSDRGDGFRLSAYRADPAGKPRGALVVAQEIFGVNSHIRSVCDGYAADGYVAIAPALFDRYERGVDIGYTPPDIARGRELKALARQSTRRCSTSPRRATPSRRQARSA